MDDKWFKKQQKIAGVTADDIAQKMGRDRSIVSRIYNGHQKMSLEWAQAFSETLKVPLNEVLKHAGALEPTQAQVLSPGYSESDAVPWVGKPSQQSSIQLTANSLGWEKSGVDIWQVKSSALILDGYAPNDYLLVDTLQSERCKAGDHVIAQAFDRQTGTETTLLRRFEPPALIASSTEPSLRRIHIVDGNNVVIKGKIIASWRK